MKTIVALLAAALSIAPVNAVTIEGNVITLNDVERDFCEANGQRHVITGKKWAEMIEEIRMLSKRECKEYTIFGVRI